jgi:TolA-binding protein
LKKELRKSIKEDEFVSGMTRGMELLEAHKDEVRVTVIALVVVAVLAGGLAYFKAARAREARLAFADALVVFETPVAGAVPGPPRGTTFATAEEKFKKAAAAFDGIARRYPGEAVTPRARYLAALSRIEMGDDAEAQKELQAVAADRASGDLVRSLAEVAQADLLRRRGKLDQAEDAYRRLAADASLAVPRDYPLWSLAQCLEESGHPQEAAEEYRRLRDEFPGSGWAQEAARMASYLSGRREEG